MIHALLDSLRPEVVEEILRRSTTPDATPDTSVKSCPSPNERRMLKSASRDLQRTFEACDATGKLVATATLAPPFKYTDVMIDIEALADTPDSAPAEIALVFFDRDDPTAHFCKYRYEPSPISAIELGFEVTAATLKWWNDQGMTIAVQHGEPLAEVLDEITRDIARHGGKGLRVWSRGNAYDLAILELAYRRTGKTTPWHFTNARDVRTHLEALNFKSPRKNNHCALDDACNHAQDVIDASNPAPAPAAKYHYECQIPILKHPGEITNGSLAGCLCITRELHDSIAATAVAMKQSPTLDLFIKSGKRPDILSASIGNVMPAIPAAFGN